MPHAANLPPWLRRPTGILRDLHGIKSLLRSGGLQTVCESARCPNIGECFRRRTATFLLLGPMCGRQCAFCAVGKGKPSPPDADEPECVTVAASRLGLQHVVITMVTRDDLEDGGSMHVARTVRSVQRAIPSATVEVLVSDFAGNIQALSTVLESEPNVLNHNIETVPRLYPLVRPQADYQRSISLLAEASRLGHRHWLKSGLMVGLGETLDEVLHVFRDLRDADCSVITVGQYLQPLRSCIPVARYWSPSEFKEIERLGRSMGIRHIAAAPYVRSSFNADLIYASMREG